MKQRREHVEFLLTRTLCCVVLMFFLAEIGVGQTSALNVKNGSNQSLFYITETGRARLGIGSDTSASLSLHGNDGFVANGLFGAGTSYSLGAGTRLLWYPLKAAFRAGFVNSDQWDDANIGTYSIALGRNTRASGQSGLALGAFTLASGLYSTAIGRGAIASGEHSFAMGRGIEAAGSNTMAISLGSLTGTVVSQDSSMVIMGGRVGIGTITPTTTLHVADTIYSSLGGFKFPDGTVQTTAATSGGGGDITDVIAGSGLTGGGTSGSVTLNVLTGQGLSIVSDSVKLNQSYTDGLYLNANETNSIDSSMIKDGSISSNDLRAGISGSKIYPNFGSQNIVTDGSLSITGDNGVVFSGTLNAGSIPATGAGVRMMWYPRQAAFRAGRVTGSHWDSDSIGALSFATGNDTKAKGLYSTAMGSGTTASGAYSMVTGGGSMAIGDFSTAAGRTTLASGDYSMAVGYNTAASGGASTAMGFSTIASGSYSTAMGNSATASGSGSMAMGFSTIASGSYSISMGSSTTSGGVFSAAIGFAAKANHGGSIVLAANSSGTASDSVWTGGNDQMVLRADGGVYITNVSEQAPYSASKLINTSTGGYLTAGGSWTNASSRNYKENISDLSLPLALGTLLQLNPVTYNYKVDAEEKHVGFIAEDVPDLVSTRDRKGLSPMDIVAVLTKVAQNQQSQIELLKKRIEALESTAEEDK